MEMHRDDVTDEASQNRLVVKKRAVVGAGAGDDEFDRQQQTGVLWLQFKASIRAQRGLRLNRVFGFPFPNLVCARCTVVKIKIENVSLFNCYNKEVL